MKIGNVLTLIAAVVVIGVALAAYGYYCFKRQADWDDVQKAAIRVDSGLRHETLIALRSKVADLDAALAHYVGGGGGRQKKRRVLSIQQAIESLEWAIDHENVPAILDGSEGFSFYENRPYLLAEPKCAESAGRLFLSGSDLVTAYLSYAHSALTTPDQSSRIRTSDIGSLRTKCASEYQEYTKERTAASEAKRIQHLRDYPLQIDIEAIGDAGDTFPFDYEIDGGQQDSDFLYQGQRKHIDAKRKVRILTQDYMNHDQHASIKVNGKAWTPHWSNSGRDDLETTITLEK